MNRKTSLFLRTTIFLFMLVLTCQPLAAKPGLISKQSKATQHTTVRDSSDEAFFKDVLQAKLPVLVDFYANWCGPCRRMAPIIDEISKSYDNKIIVVRVNIDDNPKLARLYNIDSIPSIKLFRGGKVIDESVGEITIADLRKKVNKAL
jgi:thioredoxin 1